MWFMTIFNLFLVFMATTVVLYKATGIYSTPIFILAIVYITWWFNLAALIIDPADIVNTVYRSCVLNNGEENCEKPITYVPNLFFTILYYVIFWGSQVMTWLVLPITQNYVSSGYFNTFQKLLWAVLENALIYSFIAITGLSLFIYLAVKGELDFSSFCAIIIAISQLFGITSVVCLLGYGLVEVPRSFFKAARPLVLLKSLYVKIATTSAEILDCEDRLLILCCKCEMMLANEDLDLSAKEKLLIIMGKIPEERLSMAVNNTKNSNNESLLLKASKVNPFLWKGEKNDLEKKPIFSRNYNKYIIKEAEDSGIDFSNSALVKMHKDVISISHSMKHGEATWRDSVRTALDLEEDLGLAIPTDLNMPETDSTNIEEFALTTTITGGYTEAAGSIITKYWSNFMLNINYLWRTYRLYLMRGYAIIMFINALCLSTIIMWSSPLMFITSPRLSIPALVMTTNCYLFIEIFSVTIINYISFCVLTVVMQIRIFNYFYFSLSHSTDSHSLIFSATVFSRVGPSIVLFYLQLANLEGRSNVILDVETAFIKVMGKLEFFSFLTKGYFIFLPIAIIALSICSFFNLFKKCVVDDEWSEDLENEGQQLVSEQRTCTDGKNLQFNVGSNSPTDNINYRVNSPRKELAAEKNRYNEESNMSFIERVRQIRMNRKKKEKMKNSEYEGISCDGIDI